MNTIDHWTVRPGTRTREPRFVLDLMALDGPRDAAAAGTSLFAGATRRHEASLRIEEFFGLTLRLDGTVHASEEDEHVHHEALVHPAMLSVRAPRRILLLGAGTGGALREVLRHPGVENVVAVDDDPELHALVEARLPSWSAGAFSDPRTDLRWQSPAAFVESCGDRFDVVIVDAPARPAELPLQRISRLLTPVGVCAVAAGALSHNRTRGVRRVLERLETACGNVLCASAFVPSTGADRACLFAGPGLVSLDELWPALVDRLLEQRGLADALRFYDGHAHNRLFHLPKDIRHELDLPLPLAAVA